MSPQLSKQLRTMVTSTGKLELRIESVPRPVPQDHEVLIRIEGTPINPSDLGLLIGPADVSTLSVSGSSDNPVATMDIPEGMMKAMAARLDQSLPVGNEGAGVVVDAGKGAKHLIGKMVGVAGGAMYSEYRCVAAASC